ncbi:MAG: AAA family ATPase [Deltaproteobacteria bacterium]|nr:AAA family ATPase [Deltaproteobacteria bacterium]
MANPDTSPLPYLPRLVVEHHVARAGLEPGAAEQRFQGAVMLADISGFTRLAERLARGGAAAGAERLTTILNTHFGAFIDILLARGGDVVKFAGDALVVAFPVGADTLAAAAARAVDAGLRMQEWLSGREAPDGERLAVKISLAGGEVRLAHIGGIRGRWDLLVTGPPLKEIATFSGAVEPGQVVIGPGLAPWLTGTRLAPGPGDARVVLGQDAVPPAALPPELEVGPAAERALRGYVGESVLARLDAGLPGWVGELRTVSVLFINFPNATHETPLVRADIIMRGIQAQVDRTEGTVNKISVDEKGVSMVVAWGLPPLAHEDDAERAVRCALALQDVMRRHQVRHAMGIATGHAFCGVVGSTRRREYTVMGDVVNLAARLMQAAPEDILCDGVTAAYAGARVRLLDLPPVKVKGKAEPIAVWRPQAEVTRHVIATALMVGREREREALREVVTAALEGRAQGPVVLEGDAGLGKSRLVGWLLERARAAGLPCLVGAADAVERHAPHHAWRPVLREVLQIPSGASAEVRRARVLEWVAGDAWAVERVPLLGPVLAVDLPDTPITAAMSVEARSHSTREMLLGVVRRACRRSPMLLVLEDAHWLDSASWELAMRVHGALPQVQLVVATRPPGTPAPAELRALLGEAGAVHLVLDALGAAETRELVGQRLACRSIGDDVLGAVMQRSAGHPFFSEEVALALRDAGALVMEDGVCHLAAHGDDALALPRTVQGVITARVDRLPEEQQLVLKVASAVGRVFDADTVGDLLPPATGRARLEEHVAGLREAGLIVAEGDAGAGTHAFRHALVHQAVYEQMLVSQRRELHRAVGERVLAHLADGAAPPHALLAFHFGRAGDAPRATLHLGHAAQVSLLAGAYRETLGFLDEAEALSPPTTTPGRPEHARWARLRGEALLNLGAIEQARDHLERALRLMGHRVPRSTPATTLAVLGATAVHLARRLVRPAENNAARLAVRMEAARAFERLGPVCFFLNDPAHTLHATLACLNLADTGVDSGELARAYGNMAVGTSLLGPGAIPRDFLRRAAAVAARVEDRAARGWVKLTASLVLLGWGELARAEALARDGDDLYRALGDVRRCDEATTVLIASLTARGALPEALDIARRTLDAGTRRGDVHTRAGAGSLVAAVLQRAGRQAEARAIVETAIACAQEAHVEAEHLHGLGIRALCRAHAGDVRGAVDDATAAVALMERNRPTAAYTMEGWACALEALLHPAVRPTTPPALVAAATRALQRFCAVFPVARPRALALAAAALPAGSPRRARLEADALRGERALGPSTAPSAPEN